MKRSLYVKLKNWMSNSIHPDEMAHMSPVIWIFAVCKSLLLSPVAVKELKFEKLFYLKYWQKKKKNPLTFRTLWANSMNPKNFTFFFFFFLSYSHFSPESRFDISCKLTPMETIRMKCQILFSGKNQKNIPKCPLLKMLPSMLIVKNSIC